MARVTTVTLVDDLDGTADPEVKTVRFGFDGKDYEIDLNPVNAKALAVALEPYVESARPVQRPAAAVKGRAAAGGGDAKKIREWATANGHDVPARGRIPDSLRQLYLAAQSA